MTPSWRKQKTGSRERNMAELSGRVVLVTGASRGIGAAAARALAGAGAKVVVADLTPPGELAEELDGLALALDSVKLRQSDLFNGRNVNRYILPILIEDG